MSPGVDAGREGSSRAVDELRDAHVGSDRERRERLSLLFNKRFSRNFSANPGGYGSTRGMPTRWIKMQLLLLTHALASAPRDHVLYVNEECGRADATSRNGAWRCADGSALPPPVVVVGSDGSGTRVVAKALSLMGVTMLVERSLYTQMVGTARPRAQESLR